MAVTNNSIFFVLAKRFRCKSSCQEAFLPLDTDAVSSEYLGSEEEQFNKKQNKLLQHRQIQMDKAITTTTIHVLCTSPPVPRSSCSLDRKENKKKPKKNKAYTREEHAPRAPHSPWNILKEKQNKKTKTSTLYNSKLK